jgi:hypothetical protein
MTGSSVGGAHTGHGAIRACRELAPAAWKRQGVSAGPGQVLEITALCPGEPQFGKALPQRDRRLAENSAPSMTLQSRHQGQGGLGGAAGTARSGAGAR